MIEQRIRENLEEVQARVARAAGAPGSLEEIRLVAVTKKSSPEWIRALLACDVFDLGENYPQELWKKSEALADFAGSIRWHLIGHLQSNKVKKTLPLVKMIHAVDSLKLLRVLNESARSLVDPPPVCLQVNTSGEISKHGWSAEEIVADSESIAQCRSIPVVGLMTMAGLDGTDQAVCACFASLRKPATCCVGRQACPSRSFRWECRATSSWPSRKRNARARGHRIFEGLEP